MAKRRTCNQQIAADIQKFGLAAVSAAVEMAQALSLPAPQPKPKKALKQKAAAATIQVSAELPERFDR